MLDYPTHKCRNRGGQGGHGPHRLYNFSIGIKFLPCKSDPVKPLGSPRLGCLPSYAPDPTCYIQSLIHCMDWLMLVGHIYNTIPNQVENVY